MPAQMSDNRGAKHSIIGAPAFSYMTCLTLSR